MCVYVYMYVCVYIYGYFIYRWMQACVLQYVFMYTCTCMNPRMHHDNGSLYDAYAGHWSICGSTR